MDGGLILGCHGCRRYGFSICRGTKNTILDLSHIKDDSEIMTYLDKHYKIFDAPMDDSVLINNLIEFIIKYGLIKDHMKKLVYDYRDMHKMCGLYCYVETQAEYL